MEEYTKWETILFLVPLLTISTSIFNYIYNTIRDPGLHFTFSGFMKMLGSSIIYAILLSIFTYLFYQSLFKYVYRKIKYNV